MMEEGELLDIITRNVDVLTCFNCGESLIDQTPPTLQDVLGMIKFDKGSSNYPTSPDEPASVYFECFECGKIE